MAIITPEALNRNPLNAAATSPTFALTGGKPGGKVTLASASGQYLTRANASCVGLDFGAGSFSISLWLNPASTPAGAVNVLGKGGSGSGVAGYSFVHHATTKVVFQASDGTTLYTPSGTGFAMTNGTWKHVVGVVNRVDNTIKLYGNGTLIGSATIAGMGSVTNASDFFLAGASTQYDGSLSNANMWNRALAAWEVTQLYRGGNGLAYPFNF